MTKLLGFDFVVEYRRGGEKKAANALSRKTEEGTVMAISTPTHSWIDAIQNEYETNLELHELREKFELGKLDLTRCTNHNGLLFYKGRLYIASTHLSELSF